MKCFADYKQTTCNVRFMRVTPMELLELQFIVVVITIVIIIITVINYLREKTLLLCFEVCSKQCAGEAQLDCHKRAVHDIMKPFVFVMYRDGMWSKWQVRPQSPVHTGQCAFRCSKCNEAFNQLENLRRHEDVSDLKPITEILVRSLCLFYTIRVSVA